MLTNDASPAPCPVWKWHCRVRRCFVILHQLLHAVRGATTSTRRFQARPAELVEDGVRSYRYTIFPA
jgi:hypothetical protein